LFDPILVPLDGSLVAECVLPHVIAIGQAVDAKIVLLHVLDKDQTNVASTEIDLVNWQISKTEAKLYLERIGARLQKSALQTKVIASEGPAAEEIVEFSQSQEVKLIILSSHGKSGLRKWGISSITHKIIMSAITSLLIIRAAQVRREQPYRRILVPLDGSWRAEHVLPMVTLLARFHRSQIQIVHVVKKPEMARHLPPIQEDIDLANRVIVRNHEEARYYLDQVQSHLSRAGMDVKTHLLISDNVSAAIHELADREQVDLMVLSAHGYSGNNRWPYGSMVNNFILYGKAPLLIVQDLVAKPIQAGMDQAGIRIREHVMH